MSRGASSPRSQSCGGQTWPVDWCWKSVQNEGWQNGNGGMEMGCYQQTSMDWGLEWSRLRRGCPELELLC